MKAAAGSEWVILEGNCKWFNLNIKEAAEE